jgi:hypothetical protein
MPYRSKVTRRLAVLHAFLAPVTVAAMVSCSAGDGPTTPSSPSGRIVVAPHDLTLETDQPTTFTAFSSGASGGDSLLTSVEWTATGGTIGSDGSYSAATPGTFKVIGQAAGHNLRPDTANVVVVARQSKLTGVVVTPASATLVPGASQLFTAVGTLSDGTTAPIGVTWTATGGSIDASGLYIAGSTAGTYSVIARNASKPLADTAIVTIAAAPAGGGGLATECAAPKPGWIWCDDFEQDRSSKYFEYDAAGGAFVRLAGVGNQGSYGMRARYTAGLVQTSTGSLKLAFGRTPQSTFRPVDAGTANYREIYWRVYLRTQDGWIGGAGDKLTRATIFASSTSWAQAMIAHVWGGQPEVNYLVIDPASGTDAAGNLKTTTYNDFANLRWLGRVVGKTPIFDSAHVGKWYCIEARVRLNDAGASNGVFELWINNSLEASRYDLNWVGSYNAYGLNAVFLENFWNNGAPQTEERYLDNFVVSTSRIGC